MSKTNNRRRLTVCEQIVSAQPSAGNVDREAGVIRNVQVCGPLSRNGRNYKPALQKAVKLYEGVKVNVDHGSAPGEERPLMVGFGVIRNARINGDAIYGDLHFLKSHELANRICEQAERFPETFGLSHDADIDGYVDQEGVFQVTEITAVRSVDLVGDPATARGIFESKERSMKKTFRQVIEGLKPSVYKGRKMVLEAMDEMMLNDMPVSEMDMEMPEEADDAASADAAFGALVDSVMKSGDDLATKKKKLGDILGLQEALTTGEAPAETPATEAEGDPAGDQKPEDKAMESFRKKAVAEAAAAARKAVREELQRDRHERTVDAVLESAGLPSSSPLRDELIKLKTREEMEEHVGGGSYYGSLSGRNMPVTESLDDFGKDRPSDYKSAMARYGVNVSN